MQYAPETSNDNTIEPTNAIDGEAQTSYQIGSAELHSVDTGEKFHPRNMERDILLTGSSKFNKM